MVFFCEFPTYDSFTVLMLPPGGGGPRDRGRGAALPGGGGVPARGAAHAAAAPAPARPAALRGAARAGRRRARASAGYQVQVSHHLSLKRP